MRSHTHTHSPELPFQGARTHRAECLRGRAQWLRNACVPFRIHNCARGARVLCDRIVFHWSGAERSAAKQVRANADEKKNKCVLNLLGRWHTHTHTRPSIEWIIYANRNKILGEIELYTMGLFMLWNVIEWIVMTYINFTIISCFICPNCEI